MSKTSELTNFKRINSKYIEFGKIQPRGTFYFVPTTYKGVGPLTFETPMCITPTGIHAEAARNWMDIELDVASNKEHQALYDTIKRIDDACIDESIENMDNWFKGNVDETFIEEQFKSPITAGWGNEPALLRVEIVIDKPEDITDTDGNAIAPRSVTALSACAVTLQLLGVWASDKFLGCHWRALGVRANLDHERKGRRRSSSPRRQATPPNFSRNRPKAPKAHEASEDPVQETDEQPASERIENMIQRFKNGDGGGNGENSEGYSDDDSYDDRRRRSYSESESSDEDERDDRDDRRRSYSESESESEDERGHKRYSKSSRRYSNDSEEESSEDDRRRRSYSEDSDSDSY